MNPWLYLRGETMGDRGWEWGNGESRLMERFWLSNMAKTTKKGSRKDRKKQLGKDGKSFNYPSSLSHF